VRLCGDLEGRDLVLAPTRMPTSLRVKPPVVVGQAVPPANHRSQRPFTQTLTHLHAEPPCVSMRVQDSFLVEESSSHLRRGESAAAHEIKKLALFRQNLIDQFM
jgi:hypothetical protein